MGFLHDGPPRDSLSAPSPSRRTPAFLYLWGASPAALRRSLRSARISPQEISFMSCVIVGKWRKSPELRILLDVPRTSGLSNVDAVIFEPLHGFLFIFRHAAKAQAERKSSVRG